MRTFCYLSLIGALTVGTAANADEPPGREAIIHEEFVYVEAPFPQCHASTIEEVEPGVFLTAFFGGTHERHDDVGIWISRLENGEWSTVEEVAQYEVPCWNPVLFQMPDGETLLFYKAGPTPRDWTGFLTRSRDGGKTWSEHEMLPAGVLGPVRSKPILLEDGTLYCGSSVESWRAWSVWMELTPDAGRTWRKVGPITVPGVGYHIIQPTLFHDNDGNLRMLCRSSNPRQIVTSISKDGGETWAPAWPIDLPNPSAGVDAVRMADGRIALIYNHAETHRQNLSIAVSEDGGESWTPVVTLENQEGEYSYPAMIQGSDGMLHATYTHQRTRIKYVVVDPSMF